MESEREEREREGGILPVTGSSGIPTQGTKYLETKSNTCPLLSTHLFSSEPFNVTTTPINFPLWSDCSSAFVSGLRFSRSSLEENAHVQFKTSFASPQYLLHFRYNFLLKRCNVFFKWLFHSIFARWLCGENRSR